MTDQGNDKHPTQAQLMEWHSRVLCRLQCIGICTDDKKTNHNFDKIVQFNRNDEILFESDNLMHDTFIRYAQSQNIEFEDIINKKLENNDRKQFICNQYI